MSSIKSLLTCVFGNSSHEQIQNHSSLYSSSFQSMATSRANRFKEGFASDSVAAEEYLDSGGAFWPRKTCVCVFPIVLPSNPHVGVHYSNKEQQEMIRKFMEQNASQNAWFQARFQGPFVRPTSDGQYLHQRCSYVVLLSDTNLSVYGCGCRTCLHWAHSPLVSQNSTTCSRNFSSHGTCNLMPSTPIQSLLPSSPHGNSCLLLHSLPSVRIQASLSPFIRCATKIHTLSESSH